MPFTALLGDTLDPAEFISPGIIHYENGPVTTRMIEREGRLWAVTYHAEHDKIGWRVRRVTVVPAEDDAYSLRPGNLVDVRCKIVQDHGADVELRVEGEGYTQRFWAKRSAITNLHQAAET